MEYQKHLSKFRQLLFKAQGLDLKSVLIRSASRKANIIADKVYKPQEIFHELVDAVHNNTNELSWEESYRIVSDADELKEFKDKIFGSLCEKFQWDETKATLLEGVDDKNKPLVSAVLENQHNHIMAQIAAGGTSVYDISGFLRMLIPLTSRIYNILGIKKLVGVQPLNGPVGLVYGLKYVAIDPETNERISIKEFDEKYPDWDNNQTRKMSLDVVSIALEAGSRKLQAGWTLEAMEDVKAYHGLDIEAELIAALSSEINYEISAEVIKDLKKLAGKPEKFKINPSKLKKDMSTLGVKINYHANEIARKTRRGAGNYIVIPHIMVPFFKSISTFAPTERNKKHFEELEQVGTLNGTMKVYVSLNVGDNILIGYKGGNGETDTGYFHAPYVPLMTTGVGVDPKTFQPVINLMTRYGKTVVDNAEDYYSIIEVNLSNFLEDEKED